MAYRNTGRYQPRGGAGGYRSNAGDNFGRRDSGGARRTGASSFGSLDRGSRDQYPSPWESGHGPNRNSWGGSSAASGLLPTPGGRGSESALFNQLGGLGGGNQTETLNVAASLVSALLQNQHQQRPMGGPTSSFSGPTRFDSGYGSRSHSTGFRNNRSDSFGRSDYGNRSDAGHKFGGRREFGSLPTPTRGRGFSRGRTTTTRGSKSATTTPRSNNRRQEKTTPKANSGNAKKMDPKKKKDQKELDELKAAKLQSELEKKNDKDDEDAVELIDESELKTEPKDEDDDVEVLAEKVKKEDGEKTTPAKRERERIESDYLNCYVCDLLHMTSESAFVDHVRGWKHQQMMELMEQRLEYQAKLIRIEIQVGSKRAEMENRRRASKGLGDRKRDYTYCSMCAIRVYGVDLITHRSEEPLHLKLKSFLHPRCCGIRFDTPVLYERHLLSFNHFRRNQQRDKELSGAGKDIMSVAIPPPPPVEEPTVEGTTPAADVTTDQDGDAVMNEEGSETPAGDGDVTEKAAEGDVTEKAAEGDATEKAAEGDVTEKAAEGDVTEKAMDGVEAADGETKEPTEKPQPAVEEDPEGPMPLLYDDAVAVGTQRGYKFAGMFCTACHVAMPESSWEEHCRSSMHFQRYVSMRRAADRTKRQAEEQKKAAAAEEADEVVVEDGDEEDGEKRGVKREADEEGGGKAKKAATDAPAENGTADELPEDCQHVVDEVTEEEEDDEEAPAVVQEVAEEKVPLEEVLDEAEKELDSNGAEVVEEKEEEAEQPAKEEVEAKPAGRAARGTPRGRASPRSGVARRSRGRGRR